MQISRRNCRNTEHDPGRPSAVPVYFPGGKSAGRHTQQRPGIHADLYRILHGAGNTAKKNQEKKGNPVSEKSAYCCCAKDKCQAHWYYRQNLLHLQAVSEQKAENPPKEVIQRRMHILRRIHNDLSEVFTKQVYTEYFIRPYIIVENQ